MNQFLFRNRWMALGFVAFVLLGVYFLVGSDNSPLTNAQQIAEAQRQRVAQVEGPAVLPPPPPPQIVDEPTYEEPSYDEGFSDDNGPTDDAPMDDASGTDPSGDSGDGGGYADGYSDNNPDNLPVQVLPPDDPSGEY